MNCVSKRAIRKFQRIKRYICSVWLIITWGAVFEESDKHLNDGHSKKMIELSDKLARQTSQTNLPHKLVTQTCQTYLSDKLAEKTSQTSLSDKHLHDRHSKKTTELVIAKNCLGELCWGHLVEVNWNNYIHKQQLQQQQHLVKCNSNNKNNKWCLKKVIIIFCGLATLAPKSAQSAQKCQKVSRASKSAQNGQKVPRVVKPQTILS